MARKRPHSLIAHAMQLGWRRLCRDREFFWFAMVALGMGSALTALAGAWSLGLLLQPLPYHAPEQLWTVRFYSPSLPQITSQMQVSLKLALTYAEQAPNNVACVQRSQLNLAWNTGVPASSKRPVTVDRVSESYASMLGIRLKVGHWPHVGDGSVAISLALARAHFGNANAALGKAIYLGDDIWRIAGVLGSDYLAPVRLDSQRAEDLRTAVVMPYDFASKLATFVQHDQGGDLELLERDIQKQHVQHVTQAFLRDVNLDNVNLLQIQADVQPLSEQILAGENRTTLLLWIVALVLFVTAIAGLAMFAAARHAAGGSDWFVARMLGAAGWRAGAVEYAEIMWLVVCLTGVGVLAILSGVTALGYDSRLQGVASTPLLTKAFVLLVIELAIAAAVLLFVRRIQFTHHKRENNGVTWRNCRSGSLRSPDVRVFRWLLLLQILVGLCSSILFGSSLQSAIRAFRAASGHDYKGITSIHVFLDAKDSAGSIESGLFSVRDAFEKMPNVSKVAISTASPLDLEGSHVSITMRTGGKEIIYSLSIIGADPAFFSLLGYHTIFGRYYRVGELDVAMLTPQAQIAIIGSSVPAQLSDIKAPPKKYSVLWNDQTRVVGGVEAQRVSPQNAWRDVFYGSPVVFVPFSAAATDKIAYRDAWLIVQGQAPDDRRVAQLFSQAGLPILHWQRHDLAQEVRVRLRDHLLSSAATMLLAVSILISILMGAFGAMHFSCFRRRQSYGVRLALGATEQQLLRQFARSELTWPILLVAIWTLGMWVFTKLHPAFHLGPFEIDFVYALVGSALTMFAVFTGFAVAMHRFRHLSPVEALRAE